ncbi:MAG TPA: malate dehydrogenase (quinone) [Thermomicrobiales bacterium]|nr:malate dehydrogenase (quinone) [Thermomicrobiales bacterium]
MGSTSAEVDVALIGGGIMSATLGMLLRQMRPDWSITVYERLEEVAAESSDPWNNAGTGHAALCELNYTPERPDGSIDTSKALLVNQQFHESRQFWSHLVERQVLPDPASFIRPIPHMSYVSGEKDVSFLRRRYDALAREPLFDGLEISEDPARIAGWVPLMMEGRELDGPIAMTRSEAGTDVNFGALTRFLFRALAGQGVDIRTNHDVKGITRSSDGWDVTVKDRTAGTQSTVKARFVFVGAGGRAIHLLQRSGITEAKGYGGFPVSGQFLRCTNPELIARHSAKVYGKPQVNAPPMSMPHLDTRVIGDSKGLLFGPYAGFTPKFLKRGSYADLFRSIRPDNILTMLTVAKDELPLTLYLIREVLQKHVARVATLRDFVPTAEADDWELIHAGQRVQTMKRTSNKRGKLEFGTEVVTARDGSIAGLLGASPGASTAVSIMLDVVRRCFPDEYAANLPRLREMIPTLDVDLNATPALLDEARTHSARVLGLQG